MSLKAFHIFFIAASTLLCTWFAVWCFQSGAESGTEGGVMGTTSLVAAIALALYLGWIVRKFKKASVLLLPSILFVYPHTSWACAVCFGDPKSPLTQSANTAVLFLMGVVGTILVSFATLFLTWRKRAREMA